MHSHSLVVAEEDRLLRYLHFRLSRVKAAIRVLEEVVAEDKKRPPEYGSARSQRRTGRAA